MQDAMGMLVDQGCMIEYLSKGLHAKANTGTPPLADEYRGLAVILENHWKVLEKIEVMFREELRAKEAA